MKSHCLIRGRSDQGEGGKGGREGRPGRAQGRSSRAVGRFAQAVRVDQDGAAEGQEVVEQMEPVQLRASYMGLQKRGLRSAVVETGGETAGVSQ